MGTIKYEFGLDALNTPCTELKEIRSALRAKYAELEHFFIKCESFVEENPKGANLIKAINFCNNPEKELREEELDYIDVRK